MSETSEPVRGSATPSVVTLRHRVEYGLLRLVVAALGVLPRPLSRRVGAAVGALALRLLGRLRSTGMKNLQLAFPSRSLAERQAILAAVYRNLGYQLAEFCQMPHYTARQAGTFIRYEGLDHYLHARARGKGVLVLTGHIGAWELSSFYHSLAGYPMGMVIRRLDNPLVDRFVNRVRCLHGNRVIHKDDFARGLIASMRAGETVGILMDTNMTPPQGVFVPFFGELACSASGLARVALKTGAAVVPGFLIHENDREAAAGRYVLHFGEPIQLVDTGDAEADAVANTARFTAILEASIRTYPDQWLWMHRRWKTRPAGAEKIY